MQTVFRIVVFNALIALAAVLWQVGPSVHAADVSGAVVRAEVTITNTSSTARTNALVNIPLSSVALLGSNLSNATGTNVILCSTRSTCDDSAIQVMSPSPYKHILEGAFRFDVTGGGFSTELTDANDAGLNDVAFFDGDPEDGDIFYIGHDDIPFRLAWFDIGVAGVGVYSYSWEYYNGAWSPLTNVSDTTNSFQGAGDGLALSFDLPEDGTQVSVNGATMYWIRGTLDYTSHTVAPLGSRIFQELGVATTYIDSIPANSSQTYYLFAGGPEIATSTHAVLPPTSGADTSFNMTGADIAVDGINTDDYVMEWKGRIGITNSGTRELLDGAGIHVVKFDGTGAGIMDILVDGTGVGNCNMQNFDSTMREDEFHTVRLEVETVAGLCRFYVDDILITSSTASLTAITDFGAFEFATAESFRFLEYFKIASPGFDPDVNVIVNYGGVISENFLYESGDDTEIPDRDSALGDNFPAEMLGASSHEHYWEDAEDFTVTVGPFETVVVTAAAGASEGAGAEAIGIIPTPSTQFASTTTPGLGLPLGDLIAGVAGDTNIPTTFFWVILLAVGTIVFMIVAAIVTKGNVWAVIVAGGVLQIIALSPGITVIPWWVVMFNVVVMVGMTVLYKGRSVGI